MQKLIKELPTLLNKQNELDRFIYKENNVNRNEIIEDKKVAAIVELGEMANEEQSFKYWKKDNSPKKYEDGSTRVLDEYVDVLHFGLSLQNYMLDNNDKFKQFTTKINIDELTANPLSKQQVVLQVVNHILRVGQDEYVFLLDWIILLAVKLNLSSDEILKEYDRKYQINIDRQRQGY